MAESPPIPLIHRTEVDEVPVYWAEGSGPPTVCLTFRVGQADETLVSAGISHLVEHLAFSTLGHRSYSYNGFVDNLRTVFYATGTEAQVVEFVSRICAALQQLPTDRLETERNVLQIEASKFQPGIEQRFLTLRFGADRHGLVSFEPFGLRWLDATAAAGWAADRFTSGNCILWITGPIPRDLRLELPDGMRVSPPDIRQVEMQKPAWTAQGSGGVAASLLGPRSVAFWIGVRISERRMLQRFRRDLGVTYTVFSEFRPITAELSHVTIAADCPDKHAEVVHVGMVKVLDELATNGPTAEELADEVEAVRGDFSHPGAIPGLLDRRALNELIGGPNPEEAQVLETMRAASPSEVASAVSEAAQELFLVVPEGAEVQNTRFHPYPLTSKRRVSGKSYRPRGGDRRPPGGDRELIIGKEGVSLITAQGEPITVLFGDCVGVLAWRSEERVLWGRDGFGIQIDPRVWMNGREAVKAIDSHLEPNRYIAMDITRPPLSVPPLLRVGLLRGSVE